MKIILYVLLSALVVLTSCGGDDGGGGGGGGPDREEFPNPQPPEVNIPETEVDRVMNNQNISCASIDGGPCPDGIARLFIPTPDGSYAQCTGFMIDSNTMITNQHCLKEAGQCAGMEIAIHTGNGTYQRAKCQQSSRISNDNPDNPNFRTVDVAIFDIVGTFNGGTFDIASENNRASNDDEVTAWVVDHTGTDAQLNLTDFRITELSCVAEVPSNQGVSLVLRNCPVVSGNSGSPALNQNGNLVGIVFASNIRFDSTVDLEFRRNFPGAYALITEMIYFFEDPSPEEPDPTTTGATTGDVGTTGTTGTTGTASTTTGDTTGGVTGSATTGGASGTTNGSTNGTTNGSTNGGTTGGETGVTNGSTDSTSNGTTNGTTTGGISSFGVNGL